MGSDDASEQSLLEAARRGNDEAFLRLVLPLRQDLDRIARRFVHDTHLAEDLVQETLLQAHRRLSDYRGDAPFGHWVRRIATRKCLDFLRRAKRRIQELPIDISSAELAHAACADSDNSNAQDAAELVNFLLVQLPAEDRLVITLLELEDLPVKTVAARLGWGESKVKVRAFRARQRLRQIHAASFPENDRPA